MKKSIFLFFAALLFSASAWAGWCGSSFITVNGLWCTGSNSYVHEGGKFHGKDLGTLTTLELGGEFQVWPSSTTAGTLCYKIDDGTENSISLPKTGTDGNNSKHSGSGAVDLSGLAGGSHSIAVWFKHGSDIDNNGGSNFVATFTIAAATPDPEPEPEPVADVTVHFINTPNWEEVACHHWIPNGAGTSWPGDVLSKTDEIAGYDVYTATFTGAHTSCIFNNNNKGSQTGDLTVYDGKYYEVNNDTWYDDKAAAEAALATPIPDETVYLINTGNWSKVMIHTWNGVGGTAWPGVEMTPTGETIEGYAVYSYTAKKGGQANLLFQESENVNKTGDLAWEAGKYYAPLKNEWYDTKEDAAEALAAPVEYEYVYLINTNDWAAAHIYTWTPEVAGWPGAAMTKEAEQIAGKDVYSYKVVKGTTFGGLNFNCGGDECKTGNLTWHAGKYYAPSKDTWYDDAAAAEAGLAAPVVVTYQLKGVGGWDQPGIEMVQNPDNASEYMLTCQVISATDAIKVVRLEDGVIKDYYGNGTVKDGVTVTVNYDVDGNITLPEGKYNFYFDTAQPEKKLWIAECPNIDVTLSGMVKTPVSRMGRYSYLSLDDEDGNRFSIYNGSEEAYGDFEVSGYLADDDVTVVGNGTWEVVDDVETLTATLQAEENATAIYHVTATVGVATTIILECYDATYTITDPELNEVTFTGIADGKEFTILVAPDGAGYYSDGEWDGTPILGTSVEFDDSDASEYYLGGTYIDEAGNTYEVAIFGAPASEEPTPETDVTVYFVNTKSWPSVNAYVWGTGDPYKTWPGEAMTLTGDKAHGYDVYSYTFPAEYTNCIFNGNGQTDDMTVNAGQYYDIASKTWYATLADVPNPTPAVMETVYFINTGNWEKVYAYAWTSSNNGWPGQELTKNGEKVAEFDVYPFEAEQGQWANLIFNNGSGTQTGDLTWQAGKYYVYSIGGWYDTKEAAEAALAGPATIVLHGNFLGTSWADTEAFTLSADQKTATLTTLVKAGDHEFGVRLNNVWTANGKAFTKTDNEHVIEAGSSNLTLNAEITGDYVFTWTYETNTLTVTYPTEEVVVEEHYYLIGTFNTWTQKDANYELTLDGTVYKKEVTFAKDVEFKINVGDWSSSWGKDNLGGKTYAELDYTNDGNLKMKEAKTFTIIFNPSENLITFENLTEKAPAVISYVLMGVNGDWTNGIPMTVNPDNANEYVLKGQVIAKATDALKVVTITDGVQTAWCGAVDSWSDATYELVDDGFDGKNIVLEDGIYDFYFKVSNSEIYIDQTAYVRNVTNTYGTICLPYASASTTGATFFEVVGQGTENGKPAVYLASVTELEAGVPYIFEKASTANQITVVYTGDKVNDPTDANGLIGNFTNETVVPAGNYILYSNAFIPADGTTNKVNAYRAYLNLSDVEGDKPSKPMPGRRYIGMSVQGENEATGFENIVAPEGQAIKAIVNGQLVIIRGGEMYNVQGQKL